MESRKIVLMNLFTKKSWRHKENRLVDTAREERVVLIEKVALIYIHYHV